MVKYINYFFFKINNKLSFGIRPLSGRNFTGKICVRHREGGCRKSYYLIDFFRRLNMLGFIYKIISNSIRTGFLGGIIYENGLFSYILLSENVKVGSLIYSGIANNTGFIGSTFLLKNLKLFTAISSIELYPNSGFSLVRAGGSSSIMTSFNGDVVSLKVKSGWNVKLSIYNLAVLGCVSNSKHKFNILGKAGINRHLGKRPEVRGVAMNPCDHPHGGGEGKKSPPSAQRSP